MSDRIQVLLNLALGLALMDLAVLEVTTELFAFQPNR